MRVLVIGGSGYVGALTLPFLSHHHELNVFDLLPPSDTAFSFVQGSVCDPTALANAMTGIHTVIYMAMGSHVPLNGDDWGRIEAHVEAFDVNVEGLYLALHAAHNAGVSHMVFTSSMSVYEDNGLGHEGSDEEMPPDSDQVYGLTKRLGEEVCRSACRKWGMSVNALRLFLPVPEETWLEAASAGEPTPLTTAEDTARALLAALEYRAGFQAFTISGDYGGKLTNLNKAKRLLDWEPLARPVKPDQPLSAG